MRVSRASIAGAQHSLEKASGLGRPSQAGKLLRLRLQGGQLAAGELGLKRDAIFEAARLHQLLSMIEAGRDVLLGEFEPPSQHGFATAVSRVILILIDQNPCVHWRSPMDMMRQGWSMSLFQASQQ